MGRPAALRSRPARNPLVSRREPDLNQITAVTRPQARLIDPEGVPTYIAGRRQ
jgi:hypothetical protein